MLKIEPWKSLQKFVKFLYVKLVKINDTPQRVAIGFGIGVFFGIIPGLGPLASLFTASLFRVNRASALLASLLTNTWISFVTFIASIKIGAVLMDIDWQVAKNEWYTVFKNFHFADLFKVSFMRTILPAIIGYVIVAFFLGFLSYLVILLFLHIRKRRKKPL
ncbi:MAG: DUF2062 domain-containing protein [Candidatus Omnitrophota bacterium]|jgi:hypothetical protein